MSEFTSESVAELVYDMQRILIRATAHPDDDDDDRKRNLYHVERIASAAIAKATGEPK